MSGIIDDNIPVIDHRKPVATINYEICSERSLVHIGAIVVNADWWKGVTDQNAFVMKKARRTARIAPDEDLKAFSWTAKW